MYTLKGSLVKVISEIYLSLCLCCCCCCCYCYCYHYYYYYYYFQFSIFVFFSGVAAVGTRFQVPQENL